MYTKQHYLCNWAWHGILCLFSKNWHNRSDLSCCFQVMPPILLLSDASANLFYGMLRHPFCQSTTRILDAIRDTAKQHLTLFELDGATGNERVFNHFLTSERFGPYTELIKCRNHQTNLVEGSLLLAASPSGHNLLSLFFSFTHFIRTGGHWVRLKQAMQDWVRVTAMVDRSGTQNIVTAGWTEHSKELKSYIMGTERLRKSIANLTSSFGGNSVDGSGESENSTSSSTSSKLQQRVDEFFVS